MCLWPALQVVKMHHKIYAQETFDARDVENKDLVSRNPARSRSKSNRDTDIEHVNTPIYYRTIIVSADSQRNCMVRKCVTRDTLSSRSIFRSCSVRQTLIFSKTTFCFDTICDHNHSESTAISTRYRSSRHRDFE